MKYNPNKHHRRSIRLKGYDYSQAGLYFITLCVKNRASIFGTIQNGILNLNEYGKIAFAEWQRTEKIRSNCIIHEFIIMPNHIHGIIEITKSRGESRGESQFARTTECKGESQFAPTFKSPSQTIGSIVRGYKIATIKKIKDFILGRGESRFAPTTAPTEIIKSLDFKIWQRNYYERIIRDEKAYHTISHYIINNPKKWEEDRYYK